MTHAALSRKAPETFDAYLDSSVLALEEEISKVELYHAWYINR